MPRDDVQALGDPVQPDRPGRPEEPRLRVLDEVTDQSGDEAHRDRDAEPQADARGDRGAAQRWRSSCRRQARDHPVADRVDRRPPPGRPRRPACHAVDADRRPPEPRPDRPRRLQPHPAACRLPLRSSRIRRRIGRRGATARPPGAAPATGRRPARRCRRPAAPSASDRCPAAARTHRGARPGAPLRRASSTAVADRSTPSAGTPRWTRCATKRPGPQPKSIVGPSHSSTTAWSNFASAPRPPSQLRTGSRCTRPSSWRTQQRSPSSARS